MSVTGTQVLTQVSGALPSDALFSEAQKLAALNNAIVGAWPAMKQVKVDTSVVLSGSTEEYTPTAADVTPENGFAQAYVSNNNLHKVRLTRIKQRLESASWRIIVPTDIAQAFSGETLHLQYTARTPTIAATTESIALPLDYMWKATAYYLCLAAVNKGTAVDVKSWEALVGVYERLMNESKLNNRSGSIPHSIPQVAELGSARGGGRYGQYIIP